MVSNRKLHPDPADRLQNFLCSFDNHQSEMMEPKWKKGPLKVVRLMRRPLLEQMKGSAVSSGPFNTQRFAAKTGRRVPFRSGTLSVRLGDCGLV